VCLLSTDDDPLRGKSAAENWVANILKRRPAKIAAVAMANKTARIIWAVLTPDR